MYFQLEIFFVESDQIIYVPCWHYKGEHGKISRSRFHLLFKNGAILAYWTASNFADMPYMKVVLPCPSDKYSMILNLGLLGAF